jgi:hypothetical protein
MSLNVGQNSYFGQLLPQQASARRDYCGCKKKPAAQGNNGLQALSLILLLKVLLGALSGKGGGGLPGGLPITLAIPENGQDNGGVVTTQAFPENGGGHITFGMPENPGDTYPITTQAFPENGLDDSGMVVQTLAIPENDEHRAELERINDLFRLGNFTV